MSSKQVYSCSTCGSKFLQWPSQIGSSQFCSKSCYSEAQRGKAPPNKGKKKLVEKPCEYCGEAIIGIPSSVSRRRYCSKSCASKALSITDIGDYIKRHVKKIDGSDCWLWTGYKRGGYGRLKLEGVLKEAHRVSYEYYVGKIPEGLVIDHLCRNRSCINPAHLEPVSIAENIQRGDAGKGMRSDLHKKSISEGGKRRFENPENRARQAEIIKEASKSEKRLPALRAALQKEEYKKQKSDRMKEIWIERKKGAMNASD